MAADVKLNNTAGGVHCSPGERTCVVMKKLAMQLRGEPVSETGIIFHLQHLLRVKFRAGLDDGSLFITQTRSTKIHYSQTELWITT